MGVSEQKMESRIKRLVGDMLLRGLSDPRLEAMISVTHVHLTPDLREARVFVSILSDVPTATVMQGLQAAQQRVQRQVARGMHMRSAPRVSFHLDESLKQQGRTLALLDQLQSVGPTAPPEHGRPGGSIASSGPKPGGSSDVGPAGKEMDL